MIAVGKPTASSYWYLGHHDQWRKLREVPGGKAPPTQHWMGRVHARNQQPARGYAPVRRRDYRRSAAQQGADFPTRRCLARRSRPALSLRTTCGCNKNEENDGGRSGHSDV